MPITRPRVRLRSILNLPVRESSPPPARVRFRTFGGDGGKARLMPDYTCATAGTAGVRARWRYARTTCGGPALALLDAHLADVARHSPPESVHALDVEALRAPDVTVWTAWEAGELLGCGALKEIDPHHGEIKSMRTAETHLRRGVGARILEHLIGEAKRRSYRRLSLETGSMEAFAPARRLYARFGFEPCPPFADYRPDPFSVYMTLRL